MNSRYPKAKLPKNKKVLMDVVSKAKCHIRETLQFDNIELPEAASVIRGRIARGTLLSEFRQLAAFNTTLARAIATLGAYYKIPPEFIEDELQRRILLREQGQFKRRVPNLGGCRFLYYTSERRRINRKRKRAIAMCLAVESDTSVRCNQLSQNRGPTCERYQERVRELKEDNQLIRT